MDRTTTMPLRVVAMKVTTMAMVIGGVAMALIVVTSY